MGEEMLKLTASEIIAQVRNCVMIDRAFRESARAKIRLMEKRIIERLPT